MTLPSLAMRRIRFPWLWWWDLPGTYWWFPDRICGREVMWDLYGHWRSPVAWPGIIRCLARPHVDDSYGYCCYCGKRRRPGRWWWV